MRGQGRNFDTEAGQSQQLVDDVQGVDGAGAGVDKPLLALTRQSL
jgi:hypothetical protein